MISRERVLGFLDGRPVDRLPNMTITMIFAARQYGVTYRDYVTDHRTLAAAQIAAAECFQFDHVSAISDPTREACDLGAPVQFFDWQPPSIIESRCLLADKGVLARLKLPDPLGGGRMTDRVRAIELMKQKVGGDKIVEGWIEGPGNQAANLRGMNALMLDFYDDPAFAADLMDFVVEMELGFARAQIAAGADVIGIGDPVSSLVSARLYERFIFPRQKRMVEGVQAAGARARLHICGNLTHNLPVLSQIRPDILDLDSLVPVAKAREHYGPGQVLLGWLDPVRTIAQGTPESVRAAVHNVAAAAGPRYIIGAGCEIPPETPPENVAALAVEIAAEASA